MKNKVVLGSYSEGLKRLEYLIDAKEKAAGRGREITELVRYLIGAYSPEVENFFRNREKLLRLVNCFPEAFARGLFHQLRSVRTLFYNHLVFYAILYNFFRSEKGTVSSRAKRILRERLKMEFKIHAEQFNGYVTVGQFVGFVILYPILDENTKVYCFRIILSRDDKINLNLFSDTAISILGSEENLSKIGRLDIPSKVIKSLSPSQFYNFLNAVAKSIDDMFYYYVPYVFSYISLNLKSRAVSEKIAVLAVANPKEALTLLKILKEYRKPLRRSEAPYDIIKEWKEFSC